MLSVEKYQKDNSVIVVMDSCDDLGENTAKILQAEICQIGSKIVRFGNNEINVFPNESVRSKNVFIIGSGSNHNGTINDNLMAMLGMVRGCNTASANQITVICAYYPYCRSDKKDQGRAPIMSRLVADLFKVSGASRLISVDLHAAQIQGFFDGPFDNLYAINDLIQKIKSDFADEKMIIVSPDAGGEKRATAWAKNMNSQCTFLTKTRNHNEISTISKHELVHQLNFTNEIVLLVDDIGDTLGTLCSAAKILKEKGAKKIIAAVTHGIFSGPAFVNLANSDIDLVYTTNTVPQSKNVEKSSKIVVVDLSNLLSRAILCCIIPSSISELF